MGQLYQRGRIYWVKYYFDGRPVRESTGCERETDARRFMRTREGAVAAGAPIPPRLDRILYDELAADLVAFYETTGKRRLEEVEDRLVYLTAFFRGRRAVSIGPALVTAYVVARKAQPTQFKTPPANRTINLELGLLKRMFRLAYKHGKLLRVPPIEMLQDAAPREGFFEEHQYQAVRRLLPEDLQAAIAIMHTYGWRKSEVVTLERRQLDLKAGTIRLEPGTTKNREGRLVYLTPQLLAQLAAQVERIRGLERKLGRIAPALFPRMTGRRAGSHGAGSAGAGRPRARTPACPGGSCTTSAGPRCVTSNAAASRARWRSSSRAIRPRACTGATRSSATPTCARPRAGSRVTHRTGTFPGTVAPA